MPRAFAAAVVLLALGACSRGDGGLVDWRLYAMGTWVDLSLPRDATRRHPELLAEIEMELHTFERDYYPWAEGELAALNRALTQRGRYETTPEMAGLVGAAQRIHAASDGAFDPGVGALVALWGFNGAEPPPALPDAAAVAAVRERSGSIGELVVDDRLIRVAAGVATDAASARSFTLDLGGIAKGAAVDRIVARLEALGIAPALVNAGGDLRVVGTRPDRDWRIGIQAPRDDGLLGSVTLYGGEAAFSSGDYERFVERDGERLHHILDPRTGFPATATRAVTVIAPDGTTADGAATAIFVAGDDWREVAERLGVDAVLRVDAAGIVEMTSAMRDRYRSSVDGSSDIIAAAD